MTAEPRDFDTRHKGDNWYDVTAQFPLLPAAPIRATITPDTARAGDAGEWVITVTADGRDLPENSHIAVEISGYWKCELGRPYPFRPEIALAGETTIAHAAWITTHCTSDAVELRARLSNNSRFWVLDVVIAGAPLPDGESVKIVIGDDMASHLRCQHHAQRAIFYTGVDLGGEGVYRPAPEHPTVDVRGAWAESLKLVAPAIARPGTPFQVRVLPVDRYHWNPATDYRGRISIAACGPGDIATAAELEFDGSTGARTFEATLDGDWGWLTACDAENGIAGRSNPISPPFADDLNIYFGDIHGQMDDSIGTGDFDEYYGWARDAELLDFAAPANHYGGRLDITEDVWRRCVDKTNEWNDPGAFVTLQGYEWGTGTGHKNVYWPGDDGQIYWGRDPQYNDTHKLWAALEGQEALTIPHHLKYIGNIDWEPRNDTFQRLVEICSAWGISESGGPRSAQVALARGHRVGFIGGTDTHLGQPGSGTHWGVEGRGYAAVYAPELTRRAIFDALYSRYCYATTGARIILGFTVGEHRMGEDIATDTASPERIFTCRVRGTHDLSAVEIVRNGDVVQRWEPEGQALDASWEDTTPLDDIAFAPTYDYDMPFVYYYLRVLQRDRHRAWSSPIWFTLS
ncbi:MAG: CehA/McbA family metallohydrolase [Armatimonadetes bacterium]|nr:CehA/McbA family metallohydrolase [Armatimonadota bacterium]